MKWVISYLIAFITLLPMRLVAQPIEPHFLPEGEILELHGEDHIAYDFEQFRLLLEMDENLFHAQEQVDLLENELELRDEQIRIRREQIDLLEMGFSALEDQYEDQGDDLQEALGTADELRYLLTECEAEPRRSFWNPTHLIIEGVLVLVTVGSLYLLLSDGG